MWWVIKLVPIILSFTWVWTSCFVCSFIIWCQFLVLPTLFAIFLHLCLIDFFACPFVFCNWIYTFIIALKKCLICAFIFITNYSFCKLNYLLKREVPLSKLRLSGKLERMLQKDIPHLLCESFCYFFYIHKHDIQFPCVKSHFK